MQHVPRFVAGQLEVSQLGHALNVLKIYFGSHL